MELRPATAADYEGTVSLVPDQDELFLIYPGGKYPFSVSQIHALERERKELTVAVDDGHVIGFANLYDVRPGQWAFIGNVMVDRNFRRKGIGRALVGNMAEIAFEKFALPEVRISVFSHNAPALLLYAGMGFRRTT